jgi:hypothetical protein
MLTGHSFENEMSFHGSDDLADESFNVRDEASEDRPSNSNEYNSNEWGIVSVSIDGSQVQVDEERSSSSSHFNSGLLIVDGVDSTLSGRHHRNNANSNFSIPGTDSLPTDIGSLDGADHLLDMEIEDTRGRMRGFCKRPVLMLLVPVVCIGMAGLGYLVKERNTWRSSTLRLEEEIQRLERDSERIKNTCEASWDQGQPDETSNLFTLVDNCWLQAKADIQLGACSFEKKDKIKELSESFKGKWEAMWKAASNLNTEFGNEGSPEGDGGKSETPQREWSDRVDATFDIPSVPSCFGEAFFAASVTLSAKMADLWGKSKRTKGEVDNASTDSLEEAVDGLSTATMAINEAMTAASDALSFEIQELSKNPSTYLADVARDAMKDASYSVKSGRVTMQGLFDAAAGVSSASWTWGEAATDTSEAVAVKVTEFMDDPLSYFEFESTKSD